RDAAATCARTPSVGRKTEETRLTDIKLRKRNRMAALLVALLWSIATLPAAAQAASEQDLSISYIGLQPGSSQDLKFTVYNVGIGRTSATQASFQVTRPSAGAVTKLPVPSLRQNQSTDLIYHLAAPCGAG